MIVAAAVALCLTCYAVMWLRIATFVMSSEPHAPSVRPPGLSPWLPAWSDLGAARAPTQPPRPPVEQAPELRPEAPPALPPAEPAVAARSKPTPGWVEHSVTRASNGLFESIEAYVVDSAADLSTFGEPEQHLAVFLLGYGEFSAKAREKQPKGSQPFVVPRLHCTFVPEGTSETLSAVAQAKVNGTAFQNRQSSNHDIKHAGEKTVFLTCPLGAMQEHPHLMERAEYGALAGTVRFTDEDGVFDTGEIAARWFLATHFEREPYRLVECSAAIHHVTGTKWLIEWIEYHVAFGFDHLHLYLYRNGVQEDDALREVVEHYIGRGLVTAHNWNAVPEVPRLRGVHVQNWEHGQRPARDDCYMRNRGVAQYVAFSDADELWALAPDDDLALAGASFALEEATDATRINKPCDHLLNYFDQQHADQPNRIGFAFKSTTIPPFPISAIQAGSEGVAVRDVFGKAIHAAADYGLFLGHIQVGEARCEARYNCGQYHHGRQKYMLRTARGSVMSNDPLFYHAVSENYEGVAAHLMVQVPLQLGYIRHYAGHFSHSRTGGLPARNRLHRPVPGAILSAIRKNIDTVPQLAQMYASSPPEKFLGLDRFNDLWRFAKETDDHAAARAMHAADHNAAVQATADVANSFMTFGRFRGRLNNQLLMFDWAFRISLAFHRTLHFKASETKHHELFLGLPESHDEELHGTALWNFTGLRQRFAFVTEYDVVASHGSVAAHPVLGRAVDDLPPECVWSYDLVKSTPAWKNLVVWARQATARPECKERIHFSTEDGLVHPYRTDTRSLGVGPLAFWSVMQPNEHLRGVARNFLRDTFGQDRQVLGIHTRSHNSYGAANAEKAMRSCKRLVNKPLDHAQRYKAARAKCKGEITAPDRPLTWPHYSQDLQGIARRRLLEKMCDIDESVIHLATGFAKEHLGAAPAIFLASDHENEQVDKLVYSLGGKSFTYDALAVMATDPARRRYPGEGNSSRGWRENIQGVLLDMLILSMSDVFFGNPGSTFSQVVCFWRMAHASETLTQEVSNTCGLVLFATGASDPSEVKCK